MKVVVLGTRSNASFAVCNYVNQHYPSCTFIFEEPISAQQLITRRIRNLGILHVAGQLAFQVLILPVLRKISAPRIAAIQQQYGLITSAPNMDTSYDVSSVNAPETAELLIRLAPHVIVIAGTRILGKKLLASLSCPVVNIHSGITPLYRGVHGAYWALYEGRPDLCGLTIHRVDPGIDTGDVLGQKIISPTKEDNFATYPWLQLGEGLSMLAPLLPRIAALENIRLVPLVSESKLRYHPTIWEYLRRGVR
jgi:methionyl-tRNA formyltransferase